MQATYAPLATKNAGVELELIVPAVLAQPPALDSYVQISRLYRRVGVGILLSSGDPRDFYAHLFNSSRAFGFFLSRVSDDEKVTAQNEAFFDAVACRDEEGARLIASLSRQSLHGGREYEEDFIYLALLQRWFLGAEVGALAPMLEEWARYAAANPDVRLPVCRALLAGDADAFDEAMTMAIESKLQQWDELRAADLLHPDDASTTCCVSTEVLAWLELADRRGLETQLEYRLAPSLARRFHRVSFPAPDEWQRPSGFSSLTAEGGG